MRLAPTFPPYLMFRHPGDSLIAAAERRFGHLAISNLIRWIAIFQLAVWGLDLFTRSGGGESSLIPYLLLDATKVYSGEVWRVLTFLFVTATANPLFILFFVFFLWFVSDGLERAWGSFRVNLYVVASMGLVMLLGLVPGIGIVVNIGIASIFFSAMFFAFATIYPEFVINLFGIIPIKAKWLALADAVLLLVNISSVPLMTIPTVLALIPYVVVFLPGFVHGMQQRGETAVRRAKFQSKVNEEGGEAFHTCATCGKTDLTDPAAEFRVTADGEEHCVECLEAAAESRKPAEG